MEKILFLMQVSAFQGMSSDQLRVISNICTEEGYKESEVLFHQGDVGDKMYIIISGKVEVINEAEGKNIVLAVLEKGTVLGEMATLGDTTRSAGIKALTPVQLLAIDKDKFHELIIEYPELSFEIFKVLSRKIRKTNTAIHELVGE